MGMMYNKKFQQHVCGIAANPPFNRYVHRTLGSPSRLSSTNAKTDRLTKTRTTEVTQERLAEK